MQGDRRCMESNPTWKFVAKLPKNKYRKTFSNEKVGGV